MDPNTHPNISPALVGVATSIEPGAATATLLTSPQMAADDRGLVHGGFAFGLADYAAMLAVNDPNVVLGAADCRFLAPVVVGQTLVAAATVETAESTRTTRRTVSVRVKADNTAVLTGTFTCFVLPKHVLDL